MYKGGGTIAAGNRSCVNVGSDRFPPNKPNARGVEITVAPYQKCPPVSVVTGGVGVCDISDLSSVASLQGRFFLSANRELTANFHNIISDVAIIPTFFTLEAFYECDMCRARNITKVYPLCEIKYYTAISDIGFSYANHWYTYFITGIITEFIIFSLYFYRSYVSIVLFSQNYFYACLNMFLFTPEDRRLRYKGKYR